MEEELSELLGSLAESNVPDLIFSISQSGKTGVLYLIKGEEQKALYFSKGKLVFAKSNSIDDRMGEQLLKQKKISTTQLNEAGKEITPTKRLGTILTEKKIITAEELVHAIIGQIKEIIFSVFQWTEGEYMFQIGALPSKEVIVLNIPIEEIIMEGIQKIDKWSWISKAVGDLETYYKVSTKQINVLGLLLLSPPAQKIINYLNEEHTVQEICEFSALGDFETCKVLWGLTAVGAIEKIASPLSSFDEKEIMKETEERPLMIQKKVNESIQNAHDEKASPADKETAKEMVQPPAEIIQARIEQIASEETPAEERPGQPENASVRETDNEMKSVAEEKLHEEANDKKKSEDAQLQQESLQNKGIELVNMKGTQEAGEPEIMPSEIIPVQQIIPAGTGMESTEPVPVQPVMELSFSDFKDLTDQADQRNLTEPASSASKEPEFDEEEIVGTINLFNEKQKYIYEYLRIELGNLANEFLFTALSKIRNDYFLLFDNVKYDDFGTLNVESLRDNIVGNLIYDYKSGFQTLLLMQLQMMEKFLESERILEINTMLDKIK